MGASQHPLGAPVRRPIYLLIEASLYHMEFQVLSRIVADVSATHLSQKRTTGVFHVVPCRSAAWCQVEDGDRIGRSTLSFVLIVQSPIDDREKRA